MQLLDCTLRDGGNVVGKGFNKELTIMMIEGLIDSNIKVIEMGNCLGIGAYDRDNSISPLNDQQYLNLIKPYLDKAEIGMFIGVKNTTEDNINLAKDNGLHFLRIGANAGDGEKAKDALKYMKKIGLKSNFAMMKGYVLSPQELAREAKMLQSYGLDQVTIMDSAGTMMPHEVRAYVREMVKSLDIPVGFHGHNNMGLSVANALAAYESGASFLDCGLLGMARSAGNLSTESAVVAFKRLGLLEDIDMYRLLHFLRDNLIPAMKEYHYHTAISPLDLVYGYSGCHSSFGKTFEDVANEFDVDLFKLIIQVSSIDRKNPSKELIIEVAEKIKNSK